MFLKWCCISWSFWAVAFLFVNSSTIPSARQSIEPQPVRQENETAWWLEEAQRFVERQLEAEPTMSVAKNSILFIGSGMSMTTLAAARPYIGSEETELAFESFPGVGMLKTYCVDQQVADSACTGTALLRGVKSNLGTIGVTAQVNRSDCTAHLNSGGLQESVKSLAQLAIDSGKVVGFVTTGRVTGAAVASLYSTSADRNWENDVQVRNSHCDSNSVMDIAKQLIEGHVGSQLRVILGGGRREFRDRAQKDEADEFGTRGDGRDLIREWVAHKYDDNASYVWNRTQFEEVSSANTDYLLGLFAPNYLNSNLKTKRDNLQERQPTLEEMVSTAISILSKHDSGYLLIVENSIIDEAHHNNHARVALDETAELSKAVEMAKSVTSPAETLIVVTSDHSQTMTYSGYPVRHNDIFGIADDGTWVTDGMPYLTLSYPIGNGFSNHMKPDGVRERINPLTLDVSPIDFQFSATVPGVSGVHGGDDVVVFALGPWAHLFEGTLEQSVVPYLIAFAGCLHQDQDLLTACTKDLAEVLEDNSK